MSQALTFRLADSLFVVAVSALLEVRQNDADLATITADEGPSLGTLLWQKQQIQVFDLRTVLALPVRVPCRTLLVIAGEPPWALAVEGVGGLLDTTGLFSLPLPDVICRQTRPFYDRLLLHAGEPMIPCLPSAWRAALQESGHG